MQVKTTNIYLKSSVGQESKGSLAGISHEALSQPCSYFKAKLREDLLMCCGRSQKIHF